MSIFRPAKIDLTGVISRRLRHPRLHRTEAGEIPPLPAALPTVRAAAPIYSYIILVQVERPQGVPAGTSIEVDIDGTPFL